jgi:hypothetical protein
MANTVQDEIYKTFLQVSGQQASALSGVSMTLADVLAQVQEMRATTQPANTKTTTSTSAASQGSSVGDTLSSVASTVLKSGFGLAPLVGGLFNLFGGGDAPAPTPLVKYALPTSIDFQATETSAGMGGLDYDQSGMARAYRPASNSDTQASQATGAQAAYAGGQPTPQTSQITVNVQAMDARSFLDRSNDIALAVRDAMLNMNAINDVVSEL